MQLCRLTVVFLQAIRYANDLKLYHNVVAKKESIEKRLASGEDHARILQETKSAIEEDKDMSRKDIENKIESYTTKGKGHTPIFLCII